MKAAKSLVCFTLPLGVPSFHRETALLSLPCFVSNDLYIYIFFKLQINVVLETVGRTLVEDRREPWTQVAPYRLESLPK